MERVIRNIHLVLFWKLISRKHQHTLYPVNRTVHFYPSLKKLATGTWVCVCGGGGGIVFVSETDIAVRSYCNSLTFFVMQ